MDERIIRVKEDTIQSYESMLCDNLVDLAKQKKPESLNVDYDIAQDELIVRVTYRLNIFDLNRMGLVNRERT